MGLTLAFTTLNTLEGVKTLELVVAAIFALAFLVILLIVDLANLPTIGLLSFALVPIGYLPVSTHQGAYSLPLVTMAVFVARAVVLHRRVTAGPQLLPLACLAAWVIVATIISPRPWTSGLWSMNFLLLVAAPALFLPGWPEARQRLEVSILGIGGALGAYATVEWILHRNPLLESFYQSGSTPLIQQWDVYRVTTTLGHPLTNGTFFAIATMLGLGMLLRRRTKWVFVATLLTGFGLIGSASRGPTLGLVVGIVVFLVVIGVSRRNTFSRGALLASAAVLAILVVPAGLYLTARSSGQEATGSTITRDETYKAGRELAEQHWLTGGGPGLTDILKREQPTGQAARGIESSAVELWVGLGLPGFLLATWLMLSVGSSALRARPELTACLVVYTVAAATYNLLEENRPALLLWGILIGLAARPQPWPRRASARPTSPDKRGLLCRAASVSRTAKDRPS